MIITLKPTQKVVQGGGNIIDKIKCKNRIGNDSNEYLIDFWNAMQNGLDLNSIKMDKDTYKDIRDNKEKYPKYMVAVAGILASYNSKWFAGYASPHYVSPTCTRYYYQESINNVLKQMPNLMDVKFICGDYKSIDVSNAMIYCDPPYANTKKFANAMNFDYDKFWDKMREWSKDNFVLVSELVAPNDFVCIWEKSVSRSIKSTDKSVATEKLFTYKNGKYAEYIKVN